MVGDKAKHPTVGVMITEDDRDLAAWFNMMKGHNASKWIAGMLAAWKMGQTLDAGGCSIPPRRDNAPAISRPTSGLLFGSGQASVSAKRSYGWTVKGANGEYIVGSIINVSVARKEIQPILDELKQDGHQLAPFIKALIRSNMQVEAANRVPDISSLNAVFMQYRLAAAKKQSREGQADPAPAPEMPTVPPKIQLSRHIAN